jgi:hypothetical protein
MLSAKQTLHPHLSLPLLWRGIKGEVQQPSNLFLSSEDELRVMVSAKQTLHPHLSLPLLWRGTKGEVQQQSNLSLWRETKGEVQQPSNLSLSYGEGLRVRSLPLH